MNNSGRVKPGNYTSLHGKVKELYQRVNTTFNMKGAEWDEANDLLSRLADAQAASATKQELDELVAALINEATQANHLATVAILQSWPFDEPKTIAA